jgi:hypothetical protein
VILPKLAFEERSSSAGTLPVRFQEATGLELTMTEGKMTKSQSKFRDLHTVEYSGRAPAKAKKRPRHRFARAV